MKKYILLFVLIGLINSQGNFFNNMTWFEKDKLLSCSILVSLTSNENTEKIKEYSTKINKTFNEFYTKITYDAFENCYNTIDNKTISAFSRNLTTDDNPKWKKEYDTFVPLNFSNFDNTTSLELTTEQRILGLKFEAIKEVLNQRQRNRKPDNGLRILNYDISKIPLIVKLLFTLGFIALLFMVILHYLNVLVNKPEHSKKKKHRKQK